VTYRPHHDVDLRELAVKVIYREWRRL